MVASSSNQRVLSYAERAKKAQAIRSPIEVIQSPPSAPRSSQSQPNITSSVSPSSTPPHTASTPSTTTSSQSPPTQVVDTKPITTTTTTISDSNIPKPAPVVEPQSQPSPQKPAPVNFWERRKEELAARNASSQKPAPQPSTSSSRSTAAPPSPASAVIPENIPAQNDDTNPTLESKSKTSSSVALDDDDDPFVVRTSRAPRPQVPVPISTDGTEDWPQVGKPLPPSVSSVSTETTKSEDPRTTNPDTTPRKGGAPKWVPLQLQTPVEVQHQPRRDPQSSRGNRQSADPSRASSNHPQSRNSRNHSGRTSANQSANQSRIHSNAGSAQSSPRNPRNRRLPVDETLASSTTNGPTHRSRTNSPLHVNPAQGTPPSFPPSDVSSQPSSYGNYLSPPQQGPSPYYSPQPTIPQVGSPAYHSPSHGPHLALPPDPSLSMPPPPVHGYPYVYPGPYISYDYMAPSAPYPYWNGHQSHPGSGTHSPAYPPSATPSTYAAALPLHIQQHFYPPPPPPPIQPQPSILSQSHSQSSSVSGARNITGSASERGSVGRGEGSSTTNSPEAACLSVVMPPPPHASSVDTDQPKINGEIRKSTSVVFGSIESPPPSTSTTISPSLSMDGDFSKDSSNIEKVFKSLAIGMDSAHATPKSFRKSVKSVGAGIGKSGGDKEDHKVANGQIILDPAIVKEAEATGETKWKFGNEGLASPAGGAVTELAVNAGMISSVHQPRPSGMNKNLEDDFKVKDFGYGFGTPGSSNLPMDAPRHADDATTKERVDEEREGEGDVHPELTGYHPQPGPSNGRPRRGGGYHNGGGYQDRGYGGGGGRRARGGLNGLGRGFGRGFGRGNNHHNGNAYQPRQGPPPSQFNVTNPPHFQGLAPHMGGGPPDPYYGGAAPQGAPLATYIPTGYEAYPPPPPPHIHPSSAPAMGTPSTTATPATPTAAHGHPAPPMPMPMSQIVFPLDSVRFYLLGQLEYYLSPQNMAQDYFLRRRMDSRGWIEISLLASFNRVKQLTRDYQLVREVLMLSTMVQVREYHVRMGGWEQFVLPDAQKSVVESEEDYSSYIPQHQHPGDSPSNPHSLMQGVEFEGGDGAIGMPPGMFQQQQWSQNHLGLGGMDGEEEVEVEDEDEEDDVVFVMGPQGEGEGGMWSHEKRI